FDHQSFQRSCPPILKEFAVFSLFRSKSCRSDEILSCILTSTFIVPEKFAKGKNFAKKSRRAFCAGRDKTKAGSSGFAGRALRAQPGLQPLADGLDEGFAVHGGGGDPLGQGA